MADTEEVVESVSAQAHERVKQDNEKLKAELAAEKQKAVDANAALAMLQTRDEAVKHFRSKGTIPDPLALATLAVDSAVIRGAQDLPSALDSWLDANASIFATATASDAERVEVQPNPSFVQPNPAATGDQARPTSVSYAEVKAKHGGVMTPAAAQEMKDAMASGNYRPGYQPPPEFTKQ